MQRRRRSGGWVASPAAAERSLLRRRSRRCNGTSAADAGALPHAAAVSVPTKRSSPWCRAASVAAEPCGNAPESPAATRPRSGAAAITRALVELFRTPQTEAPRLLRTDLAGGGGAGLGALALLPVDVVVAAVALLGPRELAACMALAPCWSNRRTTLGSGLCSDALWRPACARRWSNKAPCFRLETRGREAALRAAHPQADWFRLFRLLEADGHRWEMSSFELRHLRWARYPSQLVGAAVLQQPELPRRQRVTFALGDLHPDGVPPGAVYDVLRLASWDWLLVHRDHAFVSMRQPASFVASVAVVGHQGPAEALDVEDVWFSAGVLTPVDE